MANLAGTSTLTFGQSAALKGRGALGGSVGLSFDGQAEGGSRIEATGSTSLSFVSTAKPFNLVPVKGETSLNFGVSGFLSLSGSSAQDISVIFDLRTDQPVVQVRDDYDYTANGYNPDNIDVVITITGPDGVVYENDNYDNPDIRPGIDPQNRFKIFLPLESETAYENCLLGNYVVKVSRRLRPTEQVVSITQVTYNYDRQPPKVEAEIKSGPFSGQLVSTDITDYGPDVQSLVRQHTIKYPGGLSPPIPDIVSGEEEVTVSPIYTNKWEVKIDTYVDVRQADRLRILYQVAGEFDHCVYGDCLVDLSELVNKALSVYYEDLACNVDNQEIIQKRLVVIDTAWHLLNIAYQEGNNDAADYYASVIQKEAEAALPQRSTCEDGPSELVIRCEPAPPVGECNCLADNGLYNDQESIKLGGALVESTVINTGVFPITLQGASAGQSFKFQLSYQAADLAATDADSETRLRLVGNELQLQYRNLLSAAQDRIYTLGPEGLKEAADYSATYTDRTLVPKQYVDENFLPSDDNAWAQYPTKALTDDNDVLLIQDSTAGFGTRRIPISALFGTTDFLDLGDTPGTYAGSANYYLTVNNAATDVVFTPIPDFVQVDAPGNFENAGLGEMTSPDPTDLILIQDQSDPSKRLSYISVENLLGENAFLDLTDTPASYSNAGSKFLQVNAAQDAVEFVALPGLVDVSQPGVFSDALQGEITTLDPQDRLLVQDQSDLIKRYGYVTVATLQSIAFLGLTDTPADYTGQADRLVKVKSDESGLEFIESDQENEFVSFAVTQTNHGFSTGEFIYKDDAGIWQLAKADALRTLKIGMVGIVRDADNFDVLLYGEYQYGAPHGFTVGATYYLSVATPGDVTDIPPSTANTYKQACFEVLDDLRIKVIDQAVVDNDTGSGTVSLGGIGTYAAGENYEVDDLFFYRNNLYKVTTAFVNAPAELPYDKVEDIGIGYGASYRQTIVADPAKTWIKLLTIEPDVSGLLIVSGDGFQSSTTFSVSNSELSFNLNFVNEGTIQQKRIKVMQAANGQPYDVWIQLDTFTRDWTLDVRVITTSRSDNPIQFDQPIVPTDVEPVTGNVRLDTQIQPDSTGSTTSEGSGVPLGTIIAYASITPPKGYLLCDGSQFSALQYPDLYTFFGNSDRLPDLRGQFIRGAINQNNISGFNKRRWTTARPRSRFTTNSAGNHRHSTRYNSANTDGSWAYADSIFLLSDVRNPQSRHATKTSGAAGNHNHAVTGGGDSETAPDHVYMAFMIKAIP